MALSVINSGNRCITPSILKSSEPKDRTKVCRVRFQLPNDFKTILVDFINQKDVKPYEELLYVLRDSNIEDDDLYKLLHTSRECISLLNQKLHHFVDAILKLKWAHRSDKTAIEFQGFLVDLLSAHIYYTKDALQQLVLSFKTCDDVWIDSLPSEKSSRYYENIHNVLDVLLQIVPMSCDLLKQAVLAQFPYLRKSPQEHESYIYNILRIIEYQPHLQVDFLLLIVNKLIILDVNAPREEVEEAEDECDIDPEVFEMDGSEGMEVKSDVTKMKHPIACNLDIALDCLFRYIFSKCHDIDAKDQLNWHRTKHLYQDMLTVFNTVILPTHATHHVQFIMFYLCSFKVNLAETFINFLWKKVSSLNVPPVIRQTSVFYIASLLARATFIPISMLKDVIAEICTWIDNYISNQDGLACANSDVRVHSVFYSVCQALMYIIAFRHRDLVNTRNNLIFLQNLNLTKMVTCRLNPLKVCLPAIVQNFAAVTRMYQLAYCYSIIEHNARNTMPIIRRNEMGSTDIAQKQQLDVFFPFDPFLLHRSSRVISPIYREYQGSVGAGQSVSLQTPIQTDEEDDDFLTDHGMECTISSPVSLPDFTYSTSPGFKHK